MKLREGSIQAAGVDRVLRMFRWLPGRNSEREEAEPRALTVTDVHAQYVQFVFRTLQQLGGRSADLDDLRQEVFIAVHKKLPKYDRKRPMKAWLFGICWKVVGNYRKRAHRRYEVITNELPEMRCQAHDLSPEALLAKAELRKALGEILDELDLDKRVVFVMFEIDGMPGKEIAEVLDIPEGTVDSRLHNARKAFAAAVARRKARMSRGGQP